MMRNEKRLLFGWVMGLSLTVGFVQAQAPVQIADDISTVRRSDLAGGVEIETSLAAIRTDATTVDDGPPVPLVGGPSSANARPLPPPKKHRLTHRADAPGKRGSSWYVQRAGIGLAVFLALIVLQRLLAKTTHARLPEGAVRVCGKVPLDHKQSLHLVLIGQRLLVLLESPQGMQRLAEIADPIEVRRLLDPSSRSAQDLGSLDPVMSPIQNPERSLA